MHPADAAFLAAIRNQPDDDLPRLVYADYLDERGDPRGEFIRLQIERPALPADDSRRYELAAREHELLRAHEDQWRGPPPANVTPSEFRLGHAQAPGVRRPRRHALRLGAGPGRQAPRGGRVGQGAGRPAELDVLDRRPG